MSRLPAMTYHEVVQRLRAAGFGFDRQAKGSHEIWYNQKTKRERPCPIILVTYQPARFAQSYAKLG
jgi:predicted RNA binding protein YcfA (HicA-like mRNA interferase family)